MYYSIHIYRDPSVDGRAENVTGHQRYVEGGAVDLGCLARECVLYDIQRGALTEPGRYVAVVSFDAAIAAVEFITVKSGGLFIA